MAATHCAEKMRLEGVSEACISSFLAQHEAVASGATGCIPESAIEPASNLLRHAELTTVENVELLKATVVLKLNGGLGTSMGLDTAKSLLEVKDKNNFLDFIAKQILTFREEYNLPLRFMLMNSFSTSLDTKTFLSKYDAFQDTFHSQVELMQNKVPKIRQDNFEPAAYIEDITQEWCPPGHGDLYAALFGSGKLQSLLEEGYKYMFVSNSDNLGATLDLRLLSYMADGGFDFIMEVCERAEADKKGGHLAQCKKTGKMLLRESAQCPKEDEVEFQNISKHKFFNTNNLWINLPSLHKVMMREGGMLHLPVIRNSKTVNPTDSSTVKVFQLETAMGTAISSFDNATAIVVGRERFSPVKTCNELLALRSDAYMVTPDFRLILNASRNGNPPVISLEDKHYKFVSQFEKLVGTAVPSLVGCNRLKVVGEIEFGEGVVLQGDVVITNSDGVRKTVPSGTWTGSVQL